MISFCKSRGGAVPWIGIRRRKKDEGSDNDEGIRKTRGQLSEIRGQKMQIKSATFCRPSS